MPVARPLRIAVDAYLRGLGQVVGCVTKRLLVADPDRYDPGVPHAITLGARGEPVPLKGAAGPSGLVLDLWHRYRIVPEADAARSPAWRVVTAAYEYRLLDNVERELMVFHWQPGAVFRGPDYPHVHLSATLVARVSAEATRELPLDRVHVPTGRITLDALVRLLIVEFGVRPVAADWERRLARVEAADERRRTDGDS